MKVRLIYISLGITVNEQHYSTTVRESYEGLIEKEEITAELLARILLEQRGIDVSKHAHTIDNFRSFQQKFLDYDELLLVERYSVELDAEQMSEEEISAALKAIFDIKTTPRSIAEARSETDDEMLHSQRLSAEELASSNFPSAVADYLNDPNNRVKMITQAEDAPMIVALRAPADFRTIEISFSPNEQDIRISDVNLLADPNYNPDDNADTMYHGTAIDLVNGNNSYQSGGLLVWINALGVFGSYDNEHQNLIVFPEMNIEDFDERFGLYMQAPWSYGKDYVVPAGNVYDYFEPWKHFTFGKAVEFEELHFKMTVFYALLELGYYVKELGAIVEQYANEEEHELKVMAAIEQYCEQVQFTPAELAKVKSIDLTGGCAIYDKLIPEWKWENNLFHVKSIVDVLNLPNLEEFRAVRMLDLDDFSPLLKLQNLKKVPFIGCSDAFVQQLRNNGVQYGDKAIDYLKNWFDAEDLAKQERLEDLMLAGKDKLNEVHTLAEFNDFCIEFYGNCELLHPIKLDFGEEDNAVLEKLKSYNFPSDFIEWHRQFGSNEFWLGLTVIDNTKSLLEELENEEELLTKNNYLSFATTPQGEALVFDTNCNPPEIRVVDSNKMWAGVDEIENIYAIDYSFRKNSDGSFNNPNNLELDKVYDDNGNYRIESPYIAAYIEASLSKPAKRYEGFLKFLKISTLEAFNAVIFQFLNPDNWIEVHKKLNPRFEFLHNKAHALNRAGYPMHAIVNYERALAIKPNDKTHFALGAVLSNHVGEEQAIAHYDKALEMNPEYGSVYNNRAFAYYKLKRFEEALEDIDKSISLNPESGMAHATRAEIMFGLHNEAGMFQSLKNSANLGFDLGTLDKAIYEQYSNDKRYIAIVGS